jgi:carbon storage regulator
MQAKLAKLSQRPYPVNRIPPNLISPEILDFFDIILKTTLARTHLSQTAIIMLVLTRKIGESLAINENIRITVLEVKGKTVRLGIEAPDDIKVYRQEVLVKILEENKQAAAAGKFDPSQVGRWAKDQLQS